MKKVIWLGAGVGGIAGGWLGSLLGGGDFGWQALLGGTVGGIAGIYAAYKFGQYMGE